MKSNSQILTAVAIVTLSLTRTLAGHKYQQEFEMDSTFK